MPTQNALTVAQSVGLDFSFHRAREQTSHRRDVVSTDSFKTSYRSVSSQILINILLINLEKWEKHVGEKDFLALVSGTFIFDDLMNWHSKANIALNRKTYQEGNKQTQIAWIQFNYVVRSSFMIAGISRRLIYFGWF